MNLSDKAVLTTKEAWVYVGGRPFFEELLRAYPKLLVPIRIGRPTAESARGKTQYLRAVIDQALKSAQIDRRFAS